MSEVTAVVPNNPLDIYSWDWTYDQLSLSIRAFKQRFARLYNLIFGNGFQMITIPCTIVDIIHLSMMLTDISSGEYEPSIQQDDCIGDYVVINDYTVASTYVAQDDVFKVQFQITQGDIHGPVILDMIIDVLDLEILTDELNAFCEMVDYNASFGL